MRAMCSKVDGWVLHEVGLGQNARDCTCTSLWTSGRSVGRGNHNPSTVRIVHGSMLGSNFVNCVARQKVRFPLATESWACDHIDTATYPHSLRDKVALFPPKFGLRVKRESDVVWNNFWSPERQNHSKRMHPNPTCLMRSDIQKTCLLPTKQMSNYYKCKKQLPPTSPDINCCAMVCKQHLTSFNSLRSISEDLSLRVQ